LAVTGIFVLYVVLRLLLEQLDHGHVSAERIAEIVVIGGLGIMCALFVTKYYRK
jgi:hypothetical protein